MFGKDLSKETIECCIRVMHKDPEYIDNCSVNTLRFEVEELYDNATDDLIRSAMNNGVVEAEIVYKKDVDELYSLLMNDIEGYLENGGRLL